MKHNYNSLIFIPGVASLFALFLMIYPTSSVQAAACSFTFNDDTTISADCSITTDTIDGPVNSADESCTSNTATTTVDGAILTLTAGTAGTTVLTTGDISIINGGSISIGTDAEIRLGDSTSPSVFVADGDADGWSSDITTTYDATAAGRRCRSLMRGTDADCDDGSYSETNTCYSYSQSTYWRYSYGQSSYWRYGYGQSSYWGYGYGQGSYYTQGHYSYHIFWPSFSPN